MLQKIGCIAVSTFRESVRSKILYSVFFFAVIVCAAASAFGKVTIGEQGQVVQNFGLFCCSLFSLAFVVISGSLLFAKEVSRRTIFTILARPVRRFEIVAGKWLGMLITASTLVALMATALAAYVRFVFDLDPMPIFAAAYFIFTEIMIVCALVMLFSSIVVTPLLIGVFASAIFLAGRSSTYIDQFTNSGNHSAVVAVVLETFNRLLPNLELLAVSDRLSDGSALGISYYLFAFAYALGYSLLILIVSSLIFARREFN